MTAPFRRTLPLRFALVLLSASCGPALVSTPPAPAPRPADAPVSTPVVTAPRAARFTLPGTPATADYSVRVRTALERDSAGVTEQDMVESSARVQLVLRRDVRGGLRGTGRVDSFTVRATGASVRSSLRTSGSAAAASAPLPPLVNVNIDVLLDSTSLRATVRPTPANECDRPDVAAAALARDLLVRVPQSVAVGDTWRDSLVAFVCRGGVPITLRTTIESRVDGTDDNDRKLRLTRTITTRLEGISRSPWRQVELSGEGRGTQNVTIDLVRGTLLEIDGESTLTFRIANGSLRDAVRTQQVVQKSSVQVRSVRP